MFRSFHRTETKINPLIQHPRTRILAVFGLMIATTSINQSSWLMITGVSVLILLWWIGISLRTLLSRFLLIVPFALGALVFIPFTTPGQPIITLFSYTATAEGIELSILLSLKIAVANLLLTYLLVTMPALELIGQLRSLGMPALLVSIMQMMLRYFVLLAEEAQSMLKAQKARGLHMGALWITTRTYRRLGELLGVLFVRAYVRSQKIYMAMTSRGGGIHENEQQQLIHLTMKESINVAIELKQVSFAYGTLPVLHSIDYTLQVGSKTALLGHNGAGKSTLIALLNGLATPSSGEVTLYGEKLTHKHRQFAVQKVGVVYQDPDDQIFSSSVEEDLAFGPRNLGLSEVEVCHRVDQALADMGIRELRKCSPFELSYGQKRKVAIAGVLAMQPEIVVLDEPTAFLDSKGRTELQVVLEKLHQLGITLLIATHDIDFAAEWAEQVLILKEGSVYAQGSAELLFDEQILQGADLPLPRLVQPFRLLQDIPNTIRPRTVREAAQSIWQLMNRQNHQIKHTDERLIAKKEFR
jgi:cobalt ECF transporter T component CbiQ